MDIQKWKKKKEKATAEGNLNGIFYACKELAEIYFQEEKYDEALLQYKDMEKTCEESGNKIDYARAHRMIGEVYCEKGQFEKAIKHQMIHLNISREVNDSVEEQRALATLGRTFFLQSESFPQSLMGLTSSSEKTRALHMAKTYYVDSLSVCERLSDGQVGCKQRMEMRARLFLNLGLVLESQAKVQEAIEHIDKAASICNKFELWEDLYRCQSALGSVRHRSGNTAAAVAAFDAALQVAMRLPNKVQLLCDVLPLKAEVLMELPDLRGARQALLRAHKLKSPSLASRQEIERKLRTVAAMCECEEKLADLLPDQDIDKRKKLYEKIADMASTLRNYSVALTYYHLMLECVKKSDGNKSALVDCYVSLAQTYKDDGNLEKALEYFRLELELEKESPSEACKTALNVAEVLQLLGRVNDMMVAYSDSKHWAETNHLKRIVARCYRTSIQELGIRDNLDTELLDLASAPIEAECSDAESDDEQQQQFGSDICLEDLTDPEDIDDNDSCQKKTAIGRVRTTRTGKSFLQKRNVKGETALHLAAIEGNVHLIKKLIDQGHSLDVRDFSGWTPLHEACNHGQLAAVETLVEAGAHINDRGGPHCDGVTPLLDAASNGCLEIVEFLLEHGASPLAHTNRGESVLDCLSGWRKRYAEDTGQDLEGAALSSYNTLYRRLVIKLENAGHKVTSTGALDKNSEKIEAPLRRRGNIQQPPVLPTRQRTDSSSSSSSSSVDWSDPRGHLDVGEVCRRKSNESGETKGDAAAEYQNAIQALRKRHKPVGISLSVTRKSPAGNALLKESENVGDDWLEDDLGKSGMASRPKKKRKTDSSFIGEPLRKNCATEHSRQYTFQDSSNDESSNIDSDVVSYDSGHSILSSSFQRSRLKLNTGRKRQVSLTATGISREKVKRAESPSVSSSPDLLPVEATVPTTSPPQATPPPLPLGSIKVRIENKLFLVPIAGNVDNLTVGWLAQEASSRYYCLEGVEPECLRLQTEDGALLVPTDPLGLIMGQVVIGTPSAWKLPNLNARYQQLCSTMNASLDNRLSRILDACQATAVVSVEGMYLSTDMLVPMFKALAHHQPLRALNISGNVIGDRGIKDVADCVTKLAQLEVLDLSCTNISSDGLGHLAHAVSETRALQRLHTLKLGYNRLGDCLHQLATLIGAVPCLRRLSMPSVSLTSQAFRSTPARLSFDCLQYLNLSCNHICSEGVREVLGRLDSASIEGLRFTGAGRGTVAEVAIFVDHFRPPGLRLLDLSCCQATQSEIKNLARVLEAISSLEILRLESNPELDENSLVPLLGMMQLKELRIAGVSLTAHPHTDCHTTVTCSLANSNQGTAHRRGPHGFTIYSPIASNIC